MILLYISDIHDTHDIHDTLYSKFSGQLSNTCCSSGHTTCICGYTGCSFGCTT